MQYPPTRRLLAIRPALVAGLVTALLSAACGSNGGGTGGGTSSSSSSSSSTSASSSGSGGKGTGGEGAGGRPADPPIDVSLQGRVYDVQVPTGYDASKPAPLLVELHGYRDAADTMAPWDDEEARNLFVPEADKRGVIVALPHGSFDQTLNHWYWNATDSCCDLEGAKPNDIGYIMAVIADVQSKYSVDPKRIFVFGHSNGGFMANRIACDQADKIAGIVSLAGGTYKDQTKCAASAPIAFLQVHGDADMTIPYAGGHPLAVAVLPNAPGAIETTQDWAKKNRCDPKADTSTPPFDIVADLDGSETTALKYPTCEGNGHTELWTMHLGPHSPNFNANWAPMVFDYLMAHPKP